MEVPSRPRSANSRLLMSSSCSRRSLPVMRLRLLAVGWLVTRPSSQCLLSVRPRARGQRAGHAAELAGPAGVLGGQPLGVGPANVVGPAEPLAPPDQPGRDVDLAAEGAVPGAGRV